MDAWAIQTISVADIVALIDSRCQQDFHAVEAQAIDRSHRELQQSNAQTIAGVLGEEGFARSLSESDLEYLFTED